MDPARLQQVDDRLNVLYSLCQKYRVAEETELLALRDRYVAELAAITQSDEALLTLEQQIAQAQNGAERIARLLHEKRVATAPEMSAQIVAQLVRLGMPDVRFVIDVTESDTLLPLGKDRITYLFSANRTVDVAPVERTASGGELSRVMLSLKALLAGHMQLPTILFDEIDTGVSGRIADAMGEIICNLAESMQVIDITHLPQVASKGETHFVVYKEAGETHITRLTAEQRRVEIAKMLSGSEVTEAAKMQARILLGDN
jgi:DNA repair protein RecN (Recombination protein N)